MFGVVLWSDRNQGKAVIWCEDQGKLAYVTGEQADLCSDLELQAGDLVKFSLRMHSKLRFAENLRVVEEQSFAELPERLKSQQSSEPTRREPVLDNGAEIIPFRAKEPRHPSEPLLEARVGA